MHVLIGIVITIVALGILVVIHEGGHFLAAKLVGVQVNEFAVGMGPQLVKKQLGETVYSIRIFPIGGFVSLEGEADESKGEKSFNGKPAWAKILTLAAGPFMNVFFGFLALSVMLAALGATDGLLESIVGGFQYCVKIEVLTLQTIIDLCTGAGSMSDISGPVGIVNIVDQTVQTGVLNVLFLVILLSLNLGLINMLPLPALDGGRILFVLIRLIAGKHFTDEMENKIHYVGILLLFALMIMITVNDIRNLAG